MVRQALVALLLLSPTASVALKLARTDDDFVFGSDVNKNFGWCADDWVGKVDTDICGEDKCRDKYIELMTSMKAEGNVTDIIIGANDGVRSDPAQGLFKWYQETPTRRKVMVEASPRMFSRLKANGQSHNFSNMEFLNRAVGQHGDSFSIFCWHHEGDVFTKEPELRGEADYFEQVCQSDRANLINTLHVFDTPWFQAVQKDERLVKEIDEFNKKPHNRYRQKSHPEGLLERVASTAPRARELRAKVDKHIERFDFNAVSPGELAAQFGSPSYLQVDIEDHTTGVMRDIGRNVLGKDGFKPKLMFFEWSTGTMKDLQLFSDRGYEVCFMRHNGANIMAYRRDAFPPAIKSA